jgi:hypothetical protein
MSNHKDSNRKGMKSVFHNFLCWPPSIAHTLSFRITRYIFLDGFCPSVRGGCIACSGGGGGFQCGADVYPSSRAQRTVEILQLPFFLASLVFWLFLASVVFVITLSLVHVCIHFGKPALNVV